MFDMVFVTVIIGKSSKQKLIVREIQLSQKRRGSRKERQWRKGMKMKILCTCTNYTLYTTL